MLWTVERVGRGDVRLRRRDDDDDGERRVEVLVAACRALSAVFDLPSTLAAGRGSVCLEVPKIFALSVSVWVSAGAAEPVEVERRLLVAVLRLV